MQGSPAAACPRAWVAKAPRSVMRKIPASASGVTSRGGGTGCSRRGRPLGSRPFEGAGRQRSGSCGPGQPLGHSVRTRRGPSRRPRRGGPGAALEAHRNEPMTTARRGSRPAPDAAILRQRADPAQPAEQRREAPTRCKNARPRRKSRAPNPERKAKGAAHEHGEGHGQSLKPEGPEKAPLASAPGDSPRAGTACEPSSTRRSTSTETST